MTTSQTFTATAVGPLWTEVISHLGTVNVTIDPTLTNAVVTVSTGDDEGPLADAVRGATMNESTRQALNCLTIRVPKVKGNTMTMGSSTFNFSGNSMVVGQNFGVIRGSVTGMHISGNDISIGGRKIVSGGRVVAPEGTVVSGGGMGTITVDVTLPSEMSSVQLETTSADLTVDGDLQVLDVHSLSGDVEAQGVHTLRFNTTSGDAEVDRIDARLDVNTISGDIEIGAYNGSEFRFTTISGDAHVTATPAATGSIDANTISGDITTRGTSHLRERVRTVSGKVRSR
ncbi:DUF4097 family beta strand repeat-containing protein [Streptomyces sp. NPDC012765]|uniref:DUF4097 family beta strand repeat-containing protein n=1 Tax=Streptomyces sp. NPDC012765 TaxID=3155249 RepID=UPI00340538C1